jgi:succinate dehydrogenase hydrophobic anchor subunit
MNQTIATRGALFWLVQRLTGLFLAIFLLTHVKVLHWDFNFTDKLMAPDGLLNFSFVTSRLHGSMVWLVFYSLFIFSALFHGLNGLWAVVLDFRPSKTIQTIWLAVLWGLGILVAIWGFYTLSAFYLKGGPA